MEQNQAVVPLERKKEVLRIVLVLTEAFVVVWGMEEVVLVSFALDMEVFAVGQMAVALPAARMAAAAFVVARGIVLLVLVAFAVAVRNTAAC